MGVVTHMTEEIASEEKDKHESEIINKKSFANSLKAKLEDIENFVRDDYKSSFLNIEDKTELSLAIDFEIKRIKFRKK